MNAKSCFPILNSTGRFICSLVLIVTFTGALCCANASIISYDVNLDGPSESPPNASPGTGFGTADYDTVAHTLTLSLTFSGLLGNTTASHIHAPTSVPFTGTASIATTTPTFAGFPLGVTSGTYNTVLDLTSSNSYNSAFIGANGGTTAGAETALMADIAAGKAYWNVHTTVVPGGEIRGFLVPVPEPAAIALVGTGTLLYGIRALRRRKGSSF